MEKLELKHLAPYLPYDLEFKSDDKTCILDEVIVGMNTVVDWDSNNHVINKIKPILVPMSMIDDCDIEYILSVCLQNEGYRHIDMDSFEWALIQNLDNKWIRGYHVDDKYFEITISDKGVKVYTNDIEGEASPKNISIPYDVYEHFFMRHFDVFGLIGKGLAIAK